MNNKMTKPLGYGVVYKDEDYAGILKRLTIMIIDLAIVLPVIVGGVWVDYALYDNVNNYGLYSSLLISYIYLTTLKASKYGTLGQRFTRTKIETIKGDRPGQLRMTVRLLYWMLGPINFVSDLVYILAVKEKRSVRDCLCNTIVVKAGAKPIDTHAPIRVTRVFALGLNLMYESCNNGHS